jgi:hypothetical protein
MSSGPPAKKARKSTRKVVAPISPAVTKADIAKLSYPALRFLASAFLELNPKQSHLVAVHNNLHPPPIHHDAFRKLTDDFYAEFSPMFYHERGEYRIQEVIRIVTAATATIRSQCRTAFNPLIRFDGLCALHSIAMDLVGRDHPISDKLQKEGVLCEIGE